MEGVGVLAEDAAVDITYQARSAAADRIDVAEKARELAEEVTVSITDQAILTTANGIVAAEKAGEDIERKTRELSIHNVQVFEKTASLPAAANNVGEISTSAAANIDNGEEIGEGLEPSLPLNQNPEKPM